MSAIFFKYLTVKLLKIILITWGTTDISWAMQNTLYVMHISLHSNKTSSEFLKTVPCISIKVCEKTTLNFCYIWRMYHGSIYNWGDNPQWLQLHISVFCLQSFCTWGLCQQKLQSEPSNVVMADITMTVRNLYYVVVKTVLRPLFGSFYSNTYQQNAVTVCITNNDCALFISTVNNLNIQIICFESHRHNSQFIITTLADIFLFETTCSELFSTWASKFFKFISVSVMPCLHLTSTWPRQWTWPST